MPLVLECQTQVKNFVEWVSFDWQHIWGNTNAWVWDAKDRGSRMHTLRKQIFHIIDLQKIVN